ncbi:MAG: hypothetical protein WC617_03855 [Rhodanobacter sp.]
MTIKGQPACTIAAQRYHAKIDVFRQALIEAKLALAVASTCAQRSVVDDVVLEGLFQLVNMILGEEKPGHMRFERIDSHGTFWITGR